MVRYLVLLGLVQLVVAQGVLRGVVKDQESGEPLIGTEIRILNTNLGAYSNERGFFEIRSVPPGPKRVAFLFYGYEPDTIQVQIRSNDTTFVEVMLKTKEITLEAVEITSSVSAVEQSTNISTIATIRYSPQVASGFSQEFITRLPDRNAGQLIRRVPGVSLEGNQYLIIRGLNQRYNYVFLNQAPLPSSEPDKKAFPIDQFPVKLIDQILVYKSFVASQPEDVAGGIVEIRTKELNSNSYWNISIGSGYRTGTTFLPFLSHEGQGAENLGFTQRNFPANYPNVIGLNTQQEQDFVRQLPQNWAPQQFSAPPNTNFSFVHARKMGKWQGLWLMNGSQTYQTLRILREDRMATGEYNYVFNDQQSDQQTTYNLLQSLRWQPSNHFLLSIRTLYNQQGLKRTIYREGIYYDNANELKGYSYYYREQRLFTTQTIGDWLIHEKQRLRFTLSYAHNLSYEPDYRNLTFYRPIGSEKPFLPLVPLAGSANPRATGRFFGLLKENLYFVRLDHTFYLSDQWEIQSGYYGEIRQRNFLVRNIAYVRKNFLYFDESLLQLPPETIFLAENFGEATNFGLQEITRPQDNYQGFSNNQAFYSQIRWKPINRLQLLIGARLAYNNIKVYAKDGLYQPVIYGFETLNLLPFFQTTYHTGEKTQLKFAYGRTLNRPTFREIAEFRFYNFDLNTAVVGNPNLQMAVIDNIDLRWEFYPDLGEMINFGVFYKRFRNPIENVVLPGSVNETPPYTFMNAPYATNYGAEIEIFKSLAFIPLKLLKNFGIYANAAYIYSQVDFGRSVGGQVARRPLQGQSPYIINAGISYKQKNSKWSTTLSYNVVGPRIFMVGYDNYPHIYEMPVHRIDWSMNYQIAKHWEARIYVQNLLNQPVRFLQDRNEDGKLTKDDNAFIYFKPGTLIRFRIGYAFNQ